MENAGQNTGVIILAAGASSRMGQTKQLLRIGEESLLQRTVRVALRSLFQPIVVVLGANREKIEPELSQFSVSFVLNPNWSSGMGSSIKTGLDCLLLQAPELEAVIVLVADQPLLHSGVLLDLQALRQVQQVPLAVSRYANTLGVPALFTRELFPELQRLDGASGAKSLIQQYQNQAAILDFPEGALDLDTPEDWLAFLTKINASKE